FEPIFRVMWDFAKIPLPPDAAALGLDGLKRIDVRWGFQDKALASVTRIVAPTPRRGLLAMLDGTTLEVGQVPPVPNGVEGFTAFAAKPDVIYDAIGVVLRQTDPESARLFQENENAFAAVLSARLKEDLLGRLGPLWVGYLGSEEAGARGALVTQVR